MLQCTIHVRTLITLGLKLKLPGLVLFMNAYILGYGFVTQQNQISVLRGRPLFRIVRECCRSWL